jgi:hypothetical protein
MIFIQVLRSCPKKVMLMVLVYRIIIYVEISDDIRYARNSGWVQALLVWQPQKKSGPRSRDSPLWRVESMKSRELPKHVWLKILKTRSNSDAPNLMHQSVTFPGWWHPPPASQGTDCSRKSIGTWQYCMTKMVYWFSLFSLKFRVKMLTRTR